MKTSLKRFFAGVAAAAMAVGGLALGATSAQAAGTASKKNGTLTITANYGTTDHTLTAYKIAAYNSDYQTKDGSLDRDTFKYVVDSKDEEKIETALNEAGVKGVKSATESIAEEGLKQVAGKSADSPWGYKDTGDATERQFADQLAKLIADGWKPYSQIVNASAEGTSNNLPEGLYLIIDSYNTPAKGGTNKSTQSVPMLVGTTFASLAKSTDDSLGVGTITMKNTEVPVTKQVVKNDDPTTPYTTPSYSLGDTVTFELSTTIPNYAGYKKNADPKAVDARKLVLTDTFERNDNNKIPFSDPTVAPNGVKLYRDGKEVIDGVLTKDTDYTATETKDTDGSTVTDMTFDFGKLVNGNGTTEKGTKWQTGDVIKVVLTATLNENAFVTDKAHDKNLVSGRDPVGNANSVKVDFSDHTATGYHEVKGPTVNVYSFKFNLVKQYVKDPTTKLPNAQFTIKNLDGQYLKRENGKWSTIGDSEPKPHDAYDKDTKVDTAEREKEGIFMTNSDGEIDFDGLKADTYTVHEIKATKGYFQNALPSFDVEIGAGWNTDTNNHAASVPPSGDQSLSSVSYTYDKGASGLVHAQNDTSSVTVDNVKSITELPKTGAAGIAFFSIIGVAIVAMAALFAVRARKAAKMA